VPKGSPADTYPDELGQGRAYIDVLRVHHLDLARRFLGAADGALYEIDFFVAAAMARSYSLVDGFISAFDSWNPIVAAPLLRMQIDSLVRLSYMANAPSADAVVQHIVGGGEFRTLKDAEGKRLTDRRLLEHAENGHPWIAPVYEATSGWVHFSPAHLRAAWRLTVDQSGDEPSIKVFGAVPVRPDQIPLSVLKELLAAMMKATEQVFGYAEVWEQRKGGVSVWIKAAPDRW